MRRINLAIDPDVEQTVKREMRSTRRSMNAVVNDAPRLGLGMQGKPGRPPRFTVEPHAFRFEQGICTERLEQFVDCCEHTISVEAA